MSKGLLVVLGIVGVLVLALLMVGGSYISAKKQMVAKDQTVKAAWSEVDVQLQRRADLIPNLVETVKGFTKEESTVFGDIAKANGDPKLCMYGRDITPNHHALVEKYVVLDNFHTGGAISFDGHQWLMQSFVSDYWEIWVISNGTACWAW